jgi:hypothetical protein
MGRRWSTLRVPIQDAIGQKDGDSVDDGVEAGAGGATDGCELGICFEGEELVADGAGEESEVFLDQCGLNGWKYGCKVRGSRSAVWLTIP